MISIDSEITVELGDRSYPIVAEADLIHKVGELLIPLVMSNRLFIIVDENVAALHGDKLRQVLDKSGFQQTWLTVPAGEFSKGWPQFTRLCEELLSERIERSDTVIAFGGGVVGDLAGYVAASVLRGGEFRSNPNVAVSTGRQLCGRENWDQHRPRQEFGRSFLSAQSRFD